jgi:hypothetical protein
MKQEDFNELFRQRTKKLALDIIRIVSSIKYSDAVGVLRKQLIKACTSSYRWPNHRFQITILPNH